MLSNAYFLAKFRFDTAENEPAKNLQKLKFANFAIRVRKVQGGPGALGAGARRGLRGERARAPGGRRARLRLRGPSRG